jgi:hypothetical protein
MSVSVYPLQRPNTAGRRSLFPAVAAIVVVMAMVALYSLRPVLIGATGSGATEFSSGYASAVAEFQADTRALQAQAEQVSGGGTDQILPVYIRLRDTTRAAATRFGALSAPAGAKQLYTTFTSLLREQATALDSVLRDARSGSARQLAADLQRYASLVADWLAVRPRLEALIH